MFGWLALIVGFAYGFFTPGRENLGALLKKGIIIGLVIAVVLAILGTVMNLNVLGIGTGLVANIISAIIIVLLFVLGAWLGDLLEGRRSPRNRRA